MPDTCKFEQYIDDYLLNKLSAEEEKKVEEHYFSCSSCFNKLVERNRLISVIKNEGHVLFTDINGKKAGRPTVQAVFQKALTQGRWAAAALTALLILSAAMIVIPLLRNTTPQFSLTESHVRGKTLELLQPSETILDDVPIIFSWKSAGEGVEYRITVFNSDPVWSATTQDTSIKLPVEVRQKLKTNQVYHWQVRTFSSEGFLTSISKKGRFQLSR